MRKVLLAILLLCNSAYGRDVIYQSWSININNYAPYLVSNAEKVDKSGYTYWRPSILGQMGEVQYLFTLPDNARIQFSDCFSAFDAFNGSIGEPNLDTLASVWLLADNYEFNEDVGLQDTGKSQNKIGFTRDITPGVSGLNEICITAKLFALSNLDAAQFLFSSDIGIPDYAMKIDVGYTTPEPSSLLLVFIFLVSIGLKCLLKKQTI